MTQAEYPFRVLSAHTIIINCSTAVRDQQSIIGAEATECKQRGRDPDLCESPPSRAVLTGESFNPRPRETFEEADKAA
ncbi:Uncharacterized protein DAT39_015686 [Clarias magur]|uniref:Uncharacterized protein n=1 Tax=Clarias magur TaxID=1594786 RepID=A0A8J4UGH5_CLAMG|nr:Uncharacterized protein DAT39_015686 [Clarias magur]